MDDESADAELFDDDENDSRPPVTLNLRNEPDFKARAAEVYEQYSNQFKRRFKWLRPDLFVKSLETDLEKDATSLLKVLTDAGDWDSGKDAKLDALYNLVTKKHPTEKVLVFTQFADTVRYLAHELRQRGVKAVAGVTGESEDPTGYAWRFSPASNRKREKIAPGDELRVLIATDVLSEGQNLQDAAIVVIPQHTGGRLQRNACRCGELLRSLSPLKQPQSGRCPRNHGPKQCNEPSLLRRLRSSKLSRSVPIRRRNRCNLQYRLDVLGVPYFSPSGTVLLLTSLSIRD